MTKHNNLKRLTSIILALILSSGAMLMSSCNKTDDDDTSEVDNEVVVEEETPGIPEETVETEPEVEEETEPEPELPPIPENMVTGIYNMLTGEACDEALAVKRPLGIMLNNLKASLPQHGISLADVLYEVRAETGITRYLALVQDYSKLPKTGSVRSSRDYYIDLAQAHDAIYAHAGGSTYAYMTLHERFVNNLDGTNDAKLLKGTYYRDAERRKRMASEHTLMTDGERLKLAIEDKQFRDYVWEGYTPPLSFSSVPVEFENAKDCNYIYIPFGNYVQAYLVYHEKSGLYRKGQYFNKVTTTAEGLYDSPQIDGNTGEQLAFTNVVILFAEHSEIPGDEKARISVDFEGEGKGYAITGGKMTEIIWKKPDRVTAYKLYLADGDDNPINDMELLLNIGKTYIAIVPTAPENAPVFKQLDLVFPEDEVAEEAEEAGEGAESETTEADVIDGASEDAEEASDTAETTEVSEGTEENAESADATATEAVDADAKADKDTDVNTEVQTETK